MEVEVSNYIDASDYEVAHAIMLEELEHSGFRIVGTVMLRVSEVLHCGEKDVNVQWRYTARVEVIR